jgi:dihydroflavonol-4-reductase
MRIVVTGASGHIGNCLVRELIHRGDTVKVLVHNFVNDLAAMDVEMVRGSILDPTALAGFCKGADVVFHLAARISIDNRKPELTFATNVTGTENMIRASLEAGVKRFIHFSSIDAFRNFPEYQELDENRPLSESRKNYYGYTKALSERLVVNAVKDGLDAVILSPTAVIGPYDCKKSYLGQALLRMYKRKLPFLVSGGYNWVDVRDVVRAAISSVEKGRKGEKYIIAGNYCSISELNDLVKRISGNNSRFFYIPIPIAKIAAPVFSACSILTQSTPLYTSQSLALLVNAPKNISSEKAATELGYHPRSIEQTLRDTFDWFKENHYL